MGLASVVHNGCRLPIKFDSILPTRRSSDLAKVQLSFGRGVPSYEAYLLRSQLRCRPLAYSRETEHDEGSSDIGETSPRSQQDGRIEIIDSSQSTHKPDPEEKEKNPQLSTSSAKSVAFWVGAAVVFGIGVSAKEGVGKASEFFAGYLLEQSLSVDNLFLFVLIFKYFKVPPMYQNRVLSYGIAGAVVFRLSLILLGTATLQRFAEVNLLLAAILLYSSFKLFFNEGDDSDDLSDNFIVKTCQRFIPISTMYDGEQFLTVQDGLLKATPLLLTLAVIELSDIAFAVDSIPAVFGVTRDPFIVFSSNIFAILGLRSLFTVISEGMSDLEYLQPSIALVLGFIGSKMILDYFGYHVSTEASLCLVATTLGGGVLLSLMKKSE